LFVANRKERRPKMLVIAGATGNVGSKLVEILLSRKEQIRVMSRSEKRIELFVARGAEAAVGDMKDPSFLLRVFSGADVVLSMIPSNYGAEDFRAYQNRVSESIVSAVSDAGVRYVVNLSSQGAHHAEGTGPILGLHDHEERLNGLNNVNVLHLRPAYFMENLFTFMDMIRKMSMAGSAIRGDVKFPMIATKDIAQVAADHMTKRDFSGIQVEDLLGPEDLSLNEAIRIIGKHIDRPDLKYAQLPYADAENGLVSTGMSKDASRLFIEMARAFNEGLIRQTVRHKGNTTNTTIDEFAEMFARVFNKDW